MSVYFSTCISGFQECMPSVLKEYINDFSILELYDGLVIYKTNARINQIRNIKIFNNTFLLINRFEKENLSKKKKFSVIENAMLLQQEKINSGFEDSQLINEVEQVIQTLRPKTFRIITSNENQLCSVDSALKKDIENILREQFNLEIDRLNADTEFWFLARSEGFVLTGLRLTTHKKENAVLHQGELRSELAHLLCRLSEPKKDDIFLDPFCGYGAIPKARMQIGKCSVLESSDIDKNKEPEVCSDFFQDRRCSCFNKIVTDPPWGDYEIIEEGAEIFYDKFLQKAYELLIENGLLVFITARKEEVDSLLENKYSCFDLKQKIDILVSGRKARVYVLKRSN